MENIWPGKLAFDRFGRTYHLRINSAESLYRVPELDEAHWMATSAPTSTLGCDPVFLDLVDTDHNGRIRVGEMIAAIQWLNDLLLDSSGVAQRGDILRLDEINLDCPEGKRIHDSAVKMLASIDQPEAGEIGLAQIRRIKANIEQTPVSEAGIVLPEAVDDEEVQQYIRDVITVSGGATHPSGQMGIGAAHIEAFGKVIDTCLAWHARGDLEQDSAAADLYPLGNETAQGYELLDATRARIDHFFAQCELLAFYKQWGKQPSPAGGGLLHADLQDVDSIEESLKKAPLAPLTPECRLDFGPALNPVDHECLHELRDHVLKPLLDGPVDHLSPGEWDTVKRRFASHEQWLRAKPGEAVFALGIEKLQRYRVKDYAGRVHQLIKQSKDTHLQLDNVRLAEKLVLYQAHLLGLANNFVSFPHLYDPDDRAMFETGTLVMDGRRFDLAVHVTNRAEHVKITQHSDMFILYLQIERSDAPAPLEIAVPVTSGGKGTLDVGKRGVFLDVNDREWDARVVQIIENPISLSEAMTAPFKRIGKLVGGKIEQITGTAEKQLETTTQKAMANVETGLSTSAAPAPAAGASAFATAGMLAGGGVAVAALGSAAAFITKTINDLPSPFTTIAMTIGGALLAVLVPTTVLAMIRLRRRDLSAVLEGSGWAINARMKLTYVQSRQFTHQPAYPLGANGIRRRRLWLIFVLVIVLIAGVAAVQAWWLMRQKPAPAQVETPTAPDPGSESTTDGS